VNGMTPNLDIATVSTQAAVQIIRCVVCVMCLCVLSKCKATMTHGTGKESRYQRSFTFGCALNNDAAKAFYSRYGFIDLPDSGKQFLSMKTIAGLTLLFSDYFLNSVFAESRFAFFTKQKPHT
jgi:uncharacterized protein YceK